ncbi:MAG: rhodanese-like domain-containing protein [Mycobacterium sp.]
MGDTARPANLVSPAALVDELSTGQPVVLLDVRQSAADAADLQGYLDGHLPGAVFVDLDTDLAGISTGTNGRRPLPGIEEFQKTVRRWGIDSTSPVVVYGAARSAAPARAWWLLRWAGVESVRLLDGGLAGWVNAGGAVHTGHAPAPPESDFDAVPGGLPVVAVDEVPAFAGRGLLLDARPAAKFSNPDDPTAGHIPGARSAPVSEFFDAAGYFLPSDELVRQFTRVGVGTGSEPAAYCGTGVAAALEVFVLALLGIRARLYVGSASEWTADPSRVLQR